MITWRELYSKEKDVSFYIDHISNHKIFLDSILREKPSRTLEVGVGTSTFSIFLSHLGIDAFALDIDPAIIEVAKRYCNKLNGNVNYITGNAFNLHESVSNVTYDVIFHQGLLEHFPDAEIAELLRQQLEIAPIVVFSVPIADYGKRDAGNERLMSPSNWIKILQKHGFNIVEQYS
ncbi:MAG: class I SAM-dependent methyltransferase, partial [Nitrososphaerales archaeon]